MSFEFDALQCQKTWSLVLVDSSSHMIGCCWVFKPKRNADNSVSRYKARLVAKGNHQQAGLDFDETFNLVVKPAIVRIVLSLAAQNRWSLRQLDVSNASFMALSRNMYTCSNLKALLIQHIHLMFVSYTNPYMAYGRLLVPGSKSFLLTLFLLVSLPLLLIRRCSLTNPVQLFFTSCCTLMTL